MPMIGSSCVHEQNLALQAFLVPEPDDHMHCRAAHRALQVYTEAARKAGARFGVQQQERLVGRAVQEYKQLAMGSCTALYCQRLTRVSLPISRAWLHPLAKWTCPEADAAAYLLAGDEASWVEIWWPCA